MTEFRPASSTAQCDQRRAATHQGGPLLILAGAGTGKTGTLVARAAWLREQGMQAEPHLAADVHPASRRRHARQGPAARSSPAERIFGGTFHAVAHRIIRAHAESFALPPEFSVIDPADVADVMDTLRDEHGLVGTGRRGAAGRDLRGDLLHGASARASARRRRRGWLSVVRAVHRAASRPLHRLRGVTSAATAWSTSMTSCCCGGPRWPTRPRARRCAACSTRCSSMSTRTSTPSRPTSCGCCGPAATGLTCVGDDAQAIYAFRGADPAHLRALAGTFADLSSSGCRATTGRSAASSGWPT